MLARLSLALPGRYRSQLRPSYTRSMTAAHLRCYVRLPPGHKWEQIAQEERTFLRCQRCGKEKWPFSDEAAEEAIKTYARGWGSE